MNSQKTIDQLNDSDVLLLENVRFHSGELANDDAFCRDLASLGDIFVLDAFGIIWDDIGIL